jgi:hypothetical protein
MFGFLITISNLIMSIIFLLIMIYLIKDLIITLDRKQLWTALLIFIFGITGVVVSLI